MPSKLSKKDSIESAIYPRNDLKFDLVQNYANISSEITII